MGTWRRAQTGRRLRGGWIGWMPTSGAARVRNPIFANGYLHNFWASFFFGSEFNRRSKRKEKKGKKEEEMGMRLRY